MAVNALIFDFDLTLADSTKGIYLCMKHAFAHLGYQKPEFDAVKKTIGHSLTESFKILTGNSNPEISEKFVSIYVTHADQVMNTNTFVYPEVFEVMPFFKTNGLKTAIVSTKYRYRIEDILIRDKLETYFDFVIGGEDVKSFKPDPEGLLKAIEKLNVKKSETLYIGDSTIDAKTALNAGIRFCGVLTGTTSSKEFGNLRANYVINNLKDLTKLLRL